MNSLNHPPLSSLLARLSQEAENSTASLRAEFAAMSAEEVQAQIQRPDYRNFYHHMKQHYLAVSPETATLLYMLARAVKARSIVEFGASFGISTLHLAAALKDNGGGRLITTEFEAEKIARLKENVDEAGLTGFVEIRGGDALETLSKDLPETIDMVLLDGAKTLYPKILALLESKFKPGTIVLADNADNSPAYLAHVRAPENGYLSVPFADDVELSTYLKA